MNPTIKTTRKSLQAAIALISLGAASSGFAAACPTTVSGTQTSSCTLSSTGASLTVTSTGSIVTTGNGVDVLSPNGQIKIGSSITVDAGGTISATGTGINMFHGNLSGDINNSGLIEGGNKGVFVGSNSAVSGNVINSGTILASAGISHAALAVSYASVGAINNSGLIRATNGGTGVGLFYQSQVGNITNSGTIGGAYGVGVFSNADVSGGITNQTGGIIYGSSTGVSIATHMTGGITNRGVIGSDGSGKNPGGSPGAGIAVYATTTATNTRHFHYTGDIAGGIHNSGTILGTWGISSSTSGDISGGVYNETGGKIWGGHSSSQTGITVSNHGHLSGGVHNSGEISGYAGIGVSTSSDISGGIYNDANATIHGTSVGIYVSNNSSIGGVYNAGTITGGMFGVGSSSHSDISGGIHNLTGGIISGGVSPSNTAIYASTDGTISGGVWNSGTIMGFYGVGSSSTVNLELKHGVHSDINGVYNDASGTILGVGAGGVGVYASTFGDISGGIHNSGLISAASGSAVNSAYLGDITGGVHNSGTIKGNYGIGVSSTGFLSGGVYNDAGGTIDANFTAIYSGTSSDLSGGVHNSGLIRAVITGVDTYTGGDISGGVYNAESGTILAGGTGILVGSGGKMSGSIVNDGLISAGFGIGVYNHSSMTGDIVNTGRILAASSAIYVSTGSHMSGNIDNSGTIIGSFGAPGKGLGIGIFGTAGPRKEVMSGDIINSGLISAFGVFSSAVYVGTNALMSGGIYNSGTIHSDIFAGVGVFGNSDVAGGIWNATGGLIEGSSAGINVGASGSDVSGGIHNSGTILGLASRTNSPLPGLGIDVYSSGDVSGGIYNETGGVISGSPLLKVSGGTIGAGGTIAGNGILVSSGTAGTHGSSDVSGGIYNSGTITGGGWHDVAIKVLSSNISGGIHNLEGGLIKANTTAIDLSNSGNSISITNSGTIDGAVKLGSGIFNLDGGSVINGNVVGTAGSEVHVIGDTDVEGYTGMSFTGIDSFTVDNGGILDFVNGGIITTNATVDVAHGGTVELGAGSMGTIASDYNQSGTGTIPANMGGTLLVDITHAGHGQLFVTGSADLDYSYIAANLGNGAAVAGDFTVISASGGIISATGIQVIDNSYLWDITLAPTTDTDTKIQSLDRVDLSLTRAHSIADALSTSGYASGAAGALDAAYNDMVSGTVSADMLTILGDLNSQSSAAGIQDILQGMVPVLGGQQLEFSMLSGIDGALLTGTGLADGGLASGDDAIANGAWVKYFSTDTDQSGGGSAVPGDKGRHNGYLFGYGINGGDWTAGAAIATGNGTIDGKNQLSTQTLDITSTSFMAYAGKKLEGDMFVDGSVLVGRANNDTQRISSWGTSTGSYHSGYHQLRVEAGKKLEMFTPTVDLTYAHINDNGYSETGAIDKMTVSGNSNDSLILGANGNFKYDVTDDVGFTGYLGVGFELLSGSSNVDATYQAGGPSFVTKSADPGKTIFRYGVGLHEIGIGPIDLSVNYDAESRSNYSSGTWSLKAKYNF